MLYNDWYIMNNVDKINTFYIFNKENICHLIS